MNPPKKSEHKKAVQTAQRALQHAKDAQGSVAELVHSAKPTRLQKLAWFGGALGGIATAAAVACSFLPSVEIQAVPGDLIADPLRAKFQFRNMGKFDIEGAVISCSVKSGARTVTTSGNMLKEIAGTRGQILGRLGVGAPAVVRTCGPPYLRDPFNPATITIDVTWNFVNVGHQYFLTQPSPDGKCCLMTPESDALSR